MASEIPEDGVPVLRYRRCPKHGRGLHVLVYCRGGFDCTRACLTCIEELKATGDTEKAEADEAECE